MKRIIIGVLALALLGAACADTNGQQTDEDNLKARVVRTQDGRDIQCIIWTADNKGGIACDWGSQ